MCASVDGHHDLHRFLYSFLFYLAVPFVLLRLLYRSIREPGYRQNVLQRFGFFDSLHAGDVIWIHAVSAGETIAAVPLVKRLVASGLPCLVTCMTATGRERAQVLLGDQVESCYAPYDLPGAVTRFVNSVRPRLLVTIDTELWPNTLAACERAGVRTMVVNGRMSARSADGYARFPSLTGPMMASVDQYAVQTTQHAARFIDLGAAAEKVTVTGSIKFDAGYSPGHESRLEKARQIVGGRPVLLGASTHEGEERALLAALPSLLSVVPDALLVLVPRHTHRCDHVAQLCESAGHPPVRFSELRALTANDHVLMIDVMGELESFYPVASLAFVGGSLVSVGGHNLLEAVRAGTAVIMGKHLDNIDDIAQQFIDAGGMIVAEDASELGDAVTRLMTDAEARAQLVGAAEKVMAANRGSLDRVESLLVELLEATNDHG